MIMPTFRPILLTGIVASLLLAPFCAEAFDVPPNDGFVTDAANLLTPDQKTLLEADLTQYRTITSNEIAVVIVPNLAGEAIEDAGLEMARKWGIGSTKNNGILLLVAYEERVVRFDVGYGLEGAVPDIVAKGIIDTDIVPAFRAGDYAGGITAAVDSLKKHIGNEYTAERYAEKPSDFGVSSYGIFIFFILIQWVIAIMSRTKSWWLGGVFGGIGGLVLAIAFAWWISIPVLIVLGFILDFFVSKNFQSRGKTKWWAGGAWGPGGGGRFGGGSGGGFGGFGGGGFGGGGASGRW